LRGPCTNILYLAEALLLTAVLGGCAASVRSDAAESDPIAEHVKKNLSSDMLDNFGLFVYVDKAEKGSFAQHMYVFERKGGELALRYDWPVSTGRETIETDTRGQSRSTATPMGFYELDPKRFYVSYTSTQWAETMPYAMFFSWQPDRHPTGLAIHAATGAGTDALGRRASSGCIHLSLDNAHALHDLIRTDFRGHVPELLYRDDKAGNVSSDGQFLRDQGGKLRFEAGYSVLVLIDAFDGQARIPPLS
jgi:hypothetical protein